MLIFRVFGKRSFERSLKIRKYEHDNKMVYRRFSIYSKSQKRVGSVPSH